jgi:TP901 family phage tail tape measure protein
MADLEKTVSVLFKGDDKISSTMQSISGNLGSFGNKIESSTQPLADMALAIEKIDVALLALAVGGLAYAYSKSIVFESASIDLQKVLGDQKNRIDEAEESAMALSDTYGESSTSVLQSAANFKQAGFDYDESMTLVRDSMNLMIAGDMAAAQASELVVSALKGFEAPASDAARYLDILNGVSTEYATNAEQLGIGISKLSPIAKAMNFSFEETAGILTPVIEVFRSGSESADALKTGLLKLIDDANPVRAALGSIGVSQKDLNGNLRSGKDILYDVMKAFTGLAENDKLYFTQQLVGIDQSARMVKVFDNLVKVTKVTETAMNSAGSAIEEVNLRLASGEKAVDRFLIGFENLGIRIGKEFRAATTSAIGGATDIENALSKAIKAGTFDEIFDAIREFSTEMGTYLREIAIAMPEALTKVDFSKFLSSLKDLGGSIGDVFKALFGEVDLTTPEGLAAALQKIVDGLTLLSNVSKGIADSLKPFAQELGKMGDAALDSDTKTQELTGKLLGLGQGVNTVISAFNRLAPAMEIFSGALIVNAVSNIGKLVVGLGGVGLAATGPFAIAVAATATLGAAFYYLSQHSDKLSEKLNGFDGLFGEFAEDAQVVVESLGAVSRRMNDTPEIKTFTINAETGEATEKINSLNTSVLSFPESFSVKADAKIDKLSFGEISRLMNDIPKEHSVLYKAGMSEASRAVISTMNPLLTYRELTLQLEVKNKDKINSFLSEFSKPEFKDLTINTNSMSFDKFKLDIQKVINPDGTTIWVNTDINQESLKRTEAALKELPSEKTLDIKIQGEIDKELELIKTSAATVQTAMEWKAKLDIAGIEGDTKRMEAMFSSIDNTITSTGSTLSDLFKSLPKSEFDFGAREQMAAIKDQMKMSKDAAQLQTDLITTQIKLLLTKDNLMKSGKGLIKIDSTGLEPALEQILWQILQKVQMKANETSANFLLGIA